MFPFGTFLDISISHVMIQQGGHNAFTNAHPQNGTSTPRVQDDTPPVRCSNVSKQRGSNIIVNAQPPNGKCTQRTEDESIFAHCSSNVFQPRDCPANFFVNPKVILMGKNGVVVAEGYIVTNTTSNICHRRQVNWVRKRYMF